MVTSIFNATRIVQLGAGEALVEAHNATAIPSVIILYVVMVATLLLGGIFVARKSEKFWNVFFLTVVVGGIAAWGISNMPNVVQVVAQFFASRGAS